MQKLFTNHQRSVALVLTLMLIVLLVVLVGEFSYTTKIDLFVASNSSDDLQLHYALVSALHYGLAYLKADAQSKNSNGQDGTAVDSLKDVWARKQEIRITVGKAQATLRITDESAKFNLLSLLDKNKKKQAQAQKRFERLLELFREKPPAPPAVIAKRMINWMKSKKGAVAKLKLRPGKVPVFTLKEFLLVKGIDAHLLFGVPGNKKLPGLERFVTIWSTGRININTAPQAVLQSLSENIDKEKVKNLLDYRHGEEEAAFQEIKDLKKVEGFDKKLYKEVKDLITVRSAYFSMELTAHSGRLSRTVRVVVRRQKDKLERLLWDAKEY